MAQYDLHRSDIDGTLLLNIQSDLMSHLVNRVVIPVQPPGLAPLPAQRLNPSFDILGEAQILVTQFLSTVPVEALGEVVANLAEHHFQISGAVDMLLQGV
ncbi:MULTISPECIES: CcdB family protein [Novosphingopyxis]|uniref:CcdB family protein n=1 Tax=Novosphingopyxis TaxID=2709686 RepID=UPI0016517E89|nr:MULTISPECIES: CcdB family protein [Novosphingopyxis]MBH9538298.1 CcdB family protein [Novosphingopyxis sp. YJ-S2-01]